MYFCKKSNHMSFVIIAVLVIVLLMFARLAYAIWEPIFIGILNLFRKNKINY